MQLVVITFSVFLVRTVQYNTVQHSTVSCVYFESSLIGHYSTCLREFPTCGMNKVYLVLSQGFWKLGLCQSPDEQYGGFGKLVNIHVLFRRML